MHELRVRVVDLFADYDKLRSGHVPRATFRRALGATKLDLQESELSLLEDRCVCVCVSTAARAPLSGCSARASLASSSGALLTSALRREQLSVRSSERNAHVRRVLSFGDQ